MTDKYGENLVNKENQDNKEKKTSNPVESNDFPKITEFVSQEGLEEKKDLIDKVLTDKKIKEGFEKFLQTANPRIRIKIKKDLLNCKTEDDVKSIIVENIPGYKIGEPENNKENGDKPEDKTKPEENRDLLTEVDNKEEDKQQAEEDKQQAEEDNQQAEEDKQQAEEDKQQAEEDKQQAEEDKQQVEGNKEEFDAQHRREEALKQRIELSKKNPDLINNTKKDSEGYNNIKAKLTTSGVLNQLSKNGFDEQFIDDYITIKATLQEVKNNPTYTEEEISTFDKIVKNLENSCNIADTKLSSFSDENISQTRTELFHDEIGNQSLIEAKKNNMKSESHEKAYAEIFLQMEDEEMFEKYGKFLEGDSKLFLLQYQTNPDIKSKIDDAKNNPTEENKQLLESYNRMYAEILKIKDDCDTKTRDMIEELCIISQIKGMYMCMGKGDNFDLNKSNEIRYDEEGAMILDGHIDGINFSIRQDINDPEARLQTSQKLAKSEDGNTFRFGGKDNFVKSNFVLPTQNEVFSSITETVKSDKSLEGSSNQDDYLEDLQSNIMGKMEKKYEKTKYVHHYMQEQVKGEKIVEGTLGLMKEKIPSIGNNKTLIENINQSSNKDLYDFTKILKFNIDNSTDYEKDKLNQCISKILEITNNYGSNNGTEKFDSFNYPPIIENYLKNQNWEDGGSENSRLSSLSELLRHYSENSKDTRSNSEGSEGQSSKMIINDLYKDLFESVNNESLVSKERTANEETKKADNVLDSALEGFPPSPKAPGNEMA